MPTARAHFVSAREILLIPHPRSPKVPVTVTVGAVESSDGTTTAVQPVVNCESHTSSAVNAALPRAFANSSSFCFIFFPFFPYGKFAFVKMNLFSATFELVLSERRTCSQQAENLFKFRRDAPIPRSQRSHGRVVTVAQERDPPKRDRDETTHSPFLAVAQERDPPSSLTML